MKFKVLSVVLSLAFGTTVQSAIITYIYQDGDDVRVYATGTINMDAFSSVTIGDKSSSAYDDSRVNWQGISNSATGEVKILQSDNYSGVTQFGPAVSGVNNVGTYTGSRFQFSADAQYLQVAPNYVSGSLINSYAVYTNTLLSNMGIYQTNMSGTWTYNGVSETVNVLVGTTPPSDPVPDTGSTAALLGVGVAALAFARRRLG
jgi:hypothetical protein